MGKGEEILNIQNAKHNIAGTANLELNVVVIILTFLVGEWDPCSSYFK